MRFNHNLRTVRLSLIIHGDCFQEK
jgi:hypothetical protein